MLLAYENEHAARLPVLDQLTARRDALRSGAATPSGGDQVGTNQPLRHGVAGQTPNRELRSG